MRQRLVQTREGGAACEFNAGSETFGDVAFLSYQGTFQTVARGLGDVVPRGCFCVSQGDLGLHVPRLRFLGCRCGQVAWGAQDRRVIQVSRAGAGGTRGRAWGQLPCLEGTDEMQLLVNCC